MTEKNQDKDGGEEFPEISEEERRAIIRRARARLPQLERQQAIALAKLRRIAYGDWRRLPTRR